LGKGVENEAEWEQRATLLAKGASTSRPATPVSPHAHGISDAPSDVSLYDDQKCHENAHADEFR
jgi:hypothetical protein